MVTSREKDELRARMRAVRAAVPGSERAERGRAAAGHLLALAEADLARSVLLYDAFGTELSTAGVRDALLGRGVRLLLPVLGAGRLEAALAAWTLVPSGYGPREPADPVPVDPTEIDLAVVPGLAFDRSGNRLGYGGGHFDGFLARLRPGALRAGFAFAEQLIDRVPAGPRDEPMHVVVTDAGIVDCRGQTEGG